MKAPEAPATFFKGPGESQMASKFKSNSNSDSPLSEALGGPLDEIEVHPECPRMDYEV